MQIILKLDVAGQPRGWISLHEAVTAYARGDVVYGIGDPLAPVFGGIQRLTGHRSRIDLQPIIALQGRVVSSFTPPLCNRTLFRRDEYRCLYCGGEFARSELTRDDVLPKSRGGRDRLSTRPDRPGCWLLSCTCRRQSGSGCRHEDELGR